MAGKKSSHHHSYTVGANLKHNFVSEGRQQLFVFIEPRYIQLGFSHYSPGSFLSNHAILTRKINCLVFMFSVVCSLKYKTEIKPLLKRIYSFQLLNTSPTILIID